MWVRVRVGEGACGYGCGGMGRRDGGGGGGVCAGWVGVFGSVEFSQFSLVQFS